MTIGEYVCKYLASPGRFAREAYLAPGLPEAVAMHNAAMPEYRYKVVNWTGPEGVIHATSIPPQPVTVYTLGEPGEPVRVHTKLDTERVTVPPGHVVEWLHCLSHGQGVHVTWLTLDGAVKHIHVGTDTFGLYHFDYIGHNPFDCEDCPAFGPHRTERTP